MNVVCTVRDVQLSAKNTCK